MLKFNCITKQIRKYFTKAQLQEYNTVKQNQLNFKNIIKQKEYELKYAISQNKQHKQNLENDIRYFTLCDNIHQKTINYEKAITKIINEYNYDTLLNKLESNQSQHNIYTKFCDLFGEYEISSLEYKLGLTFIGIPTDTRLLIATDLLNLKFDNLHFRIFDNETIYAKFVNNPINIIYTETIEKTYYHDQMKIIIDNSTETQFIIYKRNNSREIFVPIDYPLYDAMTNTEYVFNLSMIERMNIITELLIKKYGNNLLVDGFITNNYGQLFVY